MSCLLSSTSVRVACTSGESSLVLASLATDSTLCRLGQVGLDHRID